MLTNQQRQEFYERGYTTLPALADAGEIADMKSRLWAELKHRGITEAKSTWPKGSVDGLQAMRQDDPNPLNNNQLVAILEELLGTDGWLPKTHWGQVLLNFPTDAVWQPMPGPWHLDHAYLDDEAVSGINVFLFIDDVEPRGGGTLVIDSSPGVVRHFLQANPELKEAKHGTLNKRIMESHVWLVGLKAKGSAGDEARLKAMGTETLVFGHACRLNELTGRAGDLVICHPLLLHSASVNANKEPRMMRVQRFHHN